MTELQEKLLGILKWFHAFCAERGIRYFMIGGTMLGAVRHKGFIPWDDDVDVAVPRPDYDKLVAFSRTEQTGRYRIECFFEKKDFVYPYCKVYDTETTLVEHTRYNTRRGLFLDVFPLDGMGDTLSESKRAMRSTLWLRFLLAAHTYALRKGRAWYKNAAIVLGRCIPCNRSRLHARLDRRCAVRPYDSCTYVGVFFGLAGDREAMPREWYGTPVLYGFEDTELYGVAEPDPYLTQLYGDYMTPPPPERRSGGHEFVEIDLHKSYLDEAEQP